MISILMPIYNGIEFINDSITSIILQTFNEWELIIGINGHPENSEVFKIAKQYEEIDPRIKVHDLIGIKGKANALNEMVTLCKFNHIALLDVDDIWGYQKLEIQLKFLNDYDVIGSNCVWVGDIEGVVPKIPIYDISNFNFSEVNPIINSSSIIKKELCHWNDNWNGVEDYDIWLRLRKLDKKFFNCPEILVKHRIHKQSAFNSKGNNDKVPQLLRSHGFRK
jgi:teichuronic acid biosynthesis glycosyltransferase TuaG